MVYQLKLRVPLSNRFIMPSSKKEQGQALIILGIAIFLGCSFNNIRTNYIKITGDSAMATLVKTKIIPDRKTIAYSGIYQFKDRFNNSFAIIDDKPSEKEKFAKTREVVWKLGKPHKAIFHVAFMDNIIGVLIGVLAIIGGIFTYRAKEE